jgi:hypothetical protein
MPQLSILVALILTSCTSQAEKRDKQRLSDDSPWDRRQTARTRASDGADRVHQAATPSTHRIAGGPLASPIWPGAGASRPNVSESLGRTLAQPSQRSSCWRVRRPSSGRRLRRIATSFCGDMTDERPRGSLVVEIRHRRVSRDSDTRKLEWRRRPRGNGAANGVHDSPFSYTSCAGSRSTNLTNRWARKETVTCGYAWYVNIAGCG